MCVDDMKFIVYEGHPVLFFIYLFYVIVL